MQKTADAFISHVNNTDEENPISLKFIQDTKASVERAKLQILEFFYEIEMIRELTPEEDEQMDSIITLEICWKN